jgi:hypothetical protein
MSTKPMKPLPQAQVKIDLADADTMKCQSCENPVFIQGYIIKKISAIVSPTGEEVIAPVQVFNCGNCGEMLPLKEVNELI